MSAPWLRETNDGVVIRVHAQPHSRRNEIAGAHGGELKIRLHAPPVDGKANRVLIDFLREALGVAKSSIEILRGETSRSKQVLIRGRSIDDLERQINLPKPD